MPINNVLTIDVEDYFQVAALSDAISVNEWENIPTRVERNTNKILDLFDEHNVKGTFFTLGWVADRYPSLVKEIDRRGHEVASHGYSHQLIYSQSKDVFRDETFKSKNILEDITGKAVDGYRAASYSITKESLWAIDILVEAGFKYDSSIFPVRHDRYGIVNSPKEPYVIKGPEGGEIVEYPLTTYSMLGQDLPVAGGGYFRLYPYWLTNYFYRSLNSKGKSFAFYLHPWEVDPEQPKVEVSWFSKFRHYNNLHKCSKRLSKLLSNYQFLPMRKELERLGFLAE